MTCVDDRRAIARSLRLRAEPRHDRAGKLRRRGGGGGAVREYAEDGRAGSGDARREGARVEQLVASRGERRTERERSRLEVVLEPVRERRERGPRKRADGLWIEPRAGRADTVGLRVHVCGRE